MEPVVTAALIAAAGAVAGAVVQAVVPGSSMMGWLKGRSTPHRLLGTWDSAWGPLPAGPVRYHELITITSQRGLRLRGFATRPEQPEKKWEVEGRYDGQFLQMYYFPSPSSRNSDFLDYGCYFLRRRADGSYAGYSAGFGNYDENTEDEGTSADYHEMRRR